MKRLTKEYTVLFNGVTDVINELEVALSELKALQQKTEELYMSEDESNLTPLTPACSNG